MKSATRTVVGLTQGGLSSTALLILMALLGALSGCKTAPEIPQDVGGEIIRADAALGEIVPFPAEIEKLADGFGFTEGPVWINDGSLLFSDIPANSIFKWTPGEGIRLFLKPSGYDGESEATNLGSNGLTLDLRGRIVICQHGNRRIVRLDPEGGISVLADRYQGKRLNSPNDAVYRADGSLYFTDPPYGLAEQDNDLSKELEFNGIFRLTGGRLELLHSEMTRPNGLALSPDQTVLYVANSDTEQKLWMRFTVHPDGALGEGSVFYDVTEETDEGSPDGLKVDRRGNVYATGPGGVWIFSPEGKHLGTIKPPEVPANCHWGDADGKTLYMTARTGLYRIRLNIEGVRP